MTLKKSLTTFSSYSLILAIALLSSSCDEHKFTGFSKKVVGGSQNIWNKLTGKEQKLLNQGEIGEVANGAVNAPGHNGADCEPGKQSRPTYKPEKYKPGRSCDRTSLASEMKARIKSRVHAGGNKGNVSAAVIEIDSSGNQVGEPVLSMNGNQLEAVASSQKIVTAYLAYKYHNKIKYPIRLGTNTASIAKSGFTQSIYNTYKNRNLNSKDVLEAILARSSNTVSYEVMRSITGSSSDVTHARLINSEITKLLGSGHKTKFSNAHGLDVYNYGHKGGNQRSGVHGSTPLEMARLQAKILSDPGYKKFMSSKVRGIYTSKVGVTRRAGKNDVRITTRKSGNCKGRKFAVFYGGGKGIPTFDPVN